MPKAIYAHAVAMMPKIDDIGEIVAKRELVHISDEGARESVIVQIGRPIQIEGEDEFVCPYRVASGNYETYFWNVGIDSLQALDLSLKSIETEYLRLLQKKGGSFEFLGEPGAGYDNEGI